MLDFMQYIIYKKIKLIDVRYNFSYVFQHHTDIGSKVLLKTNIYQDWQDYSEKDLAGAVVIDGIVYYIGGKAGSIAIGTAVGAGTANPFLGWGIGAGIGIIGDKISSKAKDYFLISDSKKENGDKK